MRAHEAAAAEIPGAALSRNRKATNSVAELRLVESRRSAQVEQAGTHGRGIFQNGPWSTGASQGGVRAPPARSDRVRGALGALETLLGELDERNQSAAGSLAEGLDEYNTTWRLEKLGYHTPIEAHELRRAA